MRISDWSSDVCSSDLLERPAARYVDQCQYVAVVEQALVALERPPAAHHIIQPRHVVNADIRRQAQLSPRTVPATATQRSEERRVGQAGVSTGRSRWSTYHKKKKIK